MPFKLLNKRREKVFGDGRPRALDRNAKVRIMVLARALMRATTPGKHYGVVTAKALAVLEALLWGFHNARSGLCFPSYETIAARAGCARSTVAEALKALEEAGLLSWVNRIVRIREAMPGRDLFGRPLSRWRLIRTSNAYHFTDPGASARPVLPGDGSKSESQSGTSNQESIPLRQPPAPPVLNADNPVEAALARLGMALGAAMEVV
jgi:AraC-like DNA-binding protein